uniref:C-type lectin domain-containing protein n=1 Tax=Panagrellus redivivus TaxID=6233 RepID=A0A7E4UMY7_PANRE
MKASADTKGLLEAPIKSTLTYIGEKASENTNADRKYEGWDATCDGYKVGANLVIAPGSETENAPICDGSSNFKCQAIAN